MIFARGLLFVVVFFLFYALNFLGFLLTLSVRLLGFRWLC